MTFVVVAVIMVFFLGWLIPWKPLKFDGYVDVPEKICTGENIRLNHMSEVVNGPYTLSHIDGYGYWLDEYNRPYDTTFIPEWQEYVNPHPMEKTPGLVVRTAPPIEGEWRAAGDFTVHGRWLGVVPTVQELHTVSEPIQVVKCDFRG
jgi:hypothetical protein